MGVPLTPPPDVLIVDDEESIVWSLRRAVESMGLGAVGAASAERAFELVKVQAPRVILLDVKLPGMDGLSALEEFRRRAPSARIVIMTAHGTLDTAVKALNGGALEYLPKPFDLAQVQALIRTAMKDEPTNRQVEELRLEAAGTSGIVGRSAPMQDLFRKIAAVAGSDSSVMLIGESGTGKELLARAIHHNSARGQGPFEAINCASIPETLLESELYGHERGAFTGAEREKLGKLEIAHGGTVFLDEIGDLPLSAQVKLLRFLEDRKLCHVGGNQPVSVDIRILSATNQDLESRIAEGRFREDLYFRLNVVKIVVPPLRERRDDIPLLTAYYLNHEDGCGISDEAMRCLVEHSWPGNVRELRNTIERGVVLARKGVITPQHLPESVRSPAGSLETDVEAGIRKLVDRLVAEAPKGEMFRRVEAQWEKALIRKLLELTNRNQLRAAEMLGITRTTLKRKRDQYGL